MAGEGYTMGQACRMVGVPYSRLDYWDRSGLVSPSVMPARGRGAPRLYSFSDLVALMAVKRLRDSGIPVRKIRRSLGFLRANILSEHSSLTEVPLVTNGKSVFTLAGDKRQPVDTLRGGQMSFALNMDEIARDLRSRLASSAEGRADVRKRKR